MIKNTNNKIKSKNNKSCKLIFEKNTSFGSIKAKKVSMHNPRQTIESKITVLKPFNLLNIKKY